MNNSVEEFILANYDCRATSNLGEYRTICPFCGHTGRKFYFYFSIHAFKCYHCDTKGTLRKFFKILHSGVTGLDFSTKDFEFAVDVTDKKPIKLPSNFKAFYSNTDSDVAGSYVSYLLNRGLSLKTIYNCGLGYSPTLSYYAVVPVRDMLGKQVYYTTILTRRDLNKEKTYNPTGGVDFISKGDVLYNINQVARSNEVWIVEGPIDALSLIELHYPVVALLGKTLSNNQARLLKLAKFSTINVCLDADAVMSTLKVAEQVKTFCPNVNVCILPDSDPNQALQDHRLSEFLNNLHPFSLATSLKLKHKIFQNKS